MKELSDTIQKADWKKEKHVPVIEAPDQVKAGELFEVTVTLGKEIAHPNTTEHHISWITLYYMPEDSKYNYQVAHFEFSAHGASNAGPNTGPVYTHHEGKTSLKIDKPGTLYAMAYCNIHGLWQNSKPVALA
jgi:superoxide reductase